MAWRNDERIDSGLDFMILFLTFPIPSCSVSRHRSVFSVAAIDASFFFFWVSNQCIQIYAHSKGKNKKTKKNHNKMPPHKQTGYWNLSIFLCLKSSWKHTVLFISLLASFSQGQWEVSHRHNENTRHCTYSGSDRSNFHIMIYCLPQEWKKQWFLKQYLYYWQNTLIVHMTWFKQN